MLRRVGGGDGVNGVADTTSPPPRPRRGWPRAYTGGLTEADDEGEEGSGAPRHSDLFNPAKALILMLEHDRITHRDKRSVCMQHKG